MTAENPRRMPRFSLRSLILLVALAGSGYGVWAKWEPWGLVMKYEPTEAYHMSVGGTSEGNYIIASGPGTTITGIWEFDSGRFIGTRPFNDELWGGISSVNENVILTLWHTDWGLRVHDVTTGKLLTTISLPDNQKAVFASCIANQYGIVVTDGTHVYRYGVPWYGWAWRPMFWLTFTLGIGLLWSMWRDRAGFPATAMGSE